MEFIWTKTKTLIHIFIKTILRLTKIENGHEARVKY